MKDKKINLSKFVIFFRLDKTMKLVKKFFINTFILVLTSVFMRFVSVLFNVWLTNRIGSEGMGLFSLILSVYSLGTTFATSGINLACTRLVCQELVLGSAKGVKNAMKKCIIYSVCFGLSAFFILFFFSRSIGEGILGDSRTVNSLKLLSATLPFISLSSALGGYFCAVRRVTKNAVTGILEQFLKIFITVFLCVLASGGGLEKSMIAVVIGIVASELLSFITSFILYILDVKSHSANLTAPASSGITLRLLKMSIPLAFSAYMRSALVTLEHILIPKRLMKSGLSRAESLSSYGVISGMVFPIVFFPLAFLSAAAGLLIPELTRYKERGEKRHIDYVISKVFRFSIIFSVAVSGILIFYADTLGMLIYDNAEAGKYIKIFASLIPIMYLDTSTDAILKGLGEQVASMRYNILDALTGVLLVYFLLPPLGIKGYIITVFVCEILNASLSLQRLFKITTLKVKFFSYIIAPIIGIVGATGSCKLIFHYFKISYKFDAVSVFVGIIICFVIYYTLLRFMCCINDDDEKWFIGIFKSKKERAMRKKHRKVSSSV